VGPLGEPHPVQLEKRGMTVSQDGFSRQEAEDGIIAAATALLKAGMMFRGQHANLSARVGRDQVLMTSGGSVAHLTSANFALLDLAGNVVDGAMDASNQEVIQMHTRIYRVRSRVGAVIHTHAPHITAFAVARKPIPLAYEPLLRFGVTEPVPVVPWAPRGSEASVGAIARMAEQHPSLPAVIMANHGVLVFHDSPASAARLLTTLDEAAELVLAAQALGGAQNLDEAAVAEVQERMASFSTRG